MLKEELKRHEERERNHLNSRNNFEESITSLKNRNRQLETEVLMICTQMQLLIDSQYSIQGSKSRIGTRSKNVIQARAIQKYDWRDWRIEDQISTTSWGTQSWTSLVMPNWNTECSMQDVQHKLELDLESAKINLQRQFENEKRGLINESDILKRQLMIQQSKREEIEMSSRGELLFVKDELT